MAKCIHLGGVAMAVLAICCLALSPVCADVSSRWFDPILLKTTTDAGYMEVVLQVTPATRPGPFEYIYWVTNSAQRGMSDFYLTCVGIPDLSSFDPLAYNVVAGTRLPGSGGAVTFQRGAVVEDWGNIITGQQMAPNARPQSIYDETSQQYASSVKFRWSVLADGGLTPGGSIGFAFTSTYSPATVARDLAATFAIRTYNGDEYAYGPGPEPDPGDDPVVPEWSTVMLALSGFGCLGAFRRRFRS